MATDFPVVFGICLDAEASWLGRKPENAQRPVLLSHGTYAIREGLAPLLALLQENGIKATFFVPGVTAERYPQAVKDIARHGHEYAIRRFRQGRDARVAALLADAVVFRVDHVGWPFEAARPCDIGVGKRPERRGIRGHADDGHAARRKGARKLRRTVETSRG